MLRARFWYVVASVADRIRVGARAVQRYATGVAAPVAAIEAEMAHWARAGVVLDAVFRPPAPKPIAWQGVLTGYGARLASDIPAPETNALSDLVLAIAEHADLSNPRTDRLLRLLMPRAYAPGACAAAARSLVEFWTDGELLLVLEQVFPDIAAHARSARS